MRARLVRKGTAVWLPVALAVLAGDWALGKVGLPSPQLFAALLVGLALALALPRAPLLPPSAFTAAQAVTGVVLGAYLESSTLSAVGDRWLPVVLVSLATLAITVVAGVVLARVTALGPVTAALGSVAGGASGIVAIARELGGDDRLVAFMQYLRVLVVVLLTPVLVRLAFGVHGTASGGSSGSFLGSLSGWLLVLVAAPLGALAGRAARMPAGTLLGPLLLSGVATLFGIGGSPSPPGVLQDVAFSVIGLEIGLRFTTEQLRLAGRVLPAVLASILALVVACFGLAWVLSETAGVSLLDGYLATTPGGLYAVLPIAVGAGADTTFVLAVQVLRLLLMILAAPLVARRLVRSRAYAAR